MGCTFDRACFDLCSRDGSGYLRIWFRESLYLYAFVVFVFSRVLGCCFVCVFVLVLLLAGWWLRCRIGYNYCLVDLPLYFWCGERQFQAVYRIDDGHGPSGDM